LLGVESQGRRLASEEAQPGHAILPFPAHAEDQSLDVRRRAKWTNAGARKPRLEALEPIPEVLATPFVENRVRETPKKRRVRLMLFELSDCEVSNCLPCQMVGE
jgi:hypothetical protein